MAAEAGARAARWRTMRVRTTVAAAAVVGVALTVAGIVIVMVLRGSLEDNVETSARLRAEDVIALLDAGVAPEELSVEEDSDGDEETTLIQVVGPDGEVRLSSANVAGQPAVADVAPGSTQRVRGLSLAPEDPYLVIAEAAGPVDGGRLTVLVARALEPVDETVGRVQALLWAGIPLLLGLVALTTWTVVGRALAPVAAISAEVRAISDAELDRRVPEPGTDDEIGALARTMNQMLARLQAGRDRQRQFVSDASHELRSPITTIRHELEQAIARPPEVDLGSLAEDLLQEDLRMQRLVDDLLLLARTDETALALSRQPVDLDDVVLAAADRLRSGGVVAVDASGVEAARVVGDHGALDRAVSNLTENAARYATSRVHLTLTTDGAEAVLRVDDDGPGVPLTDRTRIFERFARLDDARARATGGAGLGLAIVAEVVAAHRGTVRCLDAPLGGARLEVRLPVDDTV